MRYLALPLFLLLVVGGGLLIGLMNIPGDWYMSLNKPSFNPPNWVFGPVWTALYVLIAIVGWRMWTRLRHSLPSYLWWLQLMLNFLWSPFFFGMQAPLGALFIILGLLAVVIAFIIETWHKDRLSAILFVPYLAWVGFATILNASIVWLN